MARPCKKNVYERIEEHKTKIRETKDYLEKVKSRIGRIIQGKR